MKKTNVVYGAYFSLKEIESLFNKLDVLDKVYSEEHINWSYELSSRLQKDDNRFTRIIKEYREPKSEIYIYGVDISRMNDDETWGKFKETISSSLTKAFKKDICCSVLTIDEDDDY